MAELDLDRSSRSTRQELEAQRVLRLSRGHRVVIGAALRRDTVQGEYLFGDRERRAIDTQRIFAHSEFQSSQRVTFHTGLLVENNSSYSNAELVLNLKPRPDLRFRASYSYAFGQDSVLENRELIPRHTLSLFGSYRLDRDTTLSSEYYYASDWIWDDVREISNRDRLDLRLARSLRIGKLDAQLSIQAELELNDNVDYLERNEVDDLYFASVSLQLP